MHGKGGARGTLRNNARGSAILNHFVRWCSPVSKWRPFWIWNKVRSLGCAASLVGGMMVILGMERIDMMMDEFMVWVVGLDSASIMV